MTGAEEDVEINRRAAESDLLVYVNVNLIALNGGPKSVAVGLASYRSLRHHHNTHTLQHSRSFNDPANSALHHSFHRMHDVIGGHLKIFTVETTVNGDTFPSAMGFLSKHGMGMEPCRQSRDISECATASVPCRPRSGGTCSTRSRRRTE